MIETLLGGLLGGTFRLAPEILKWLDRKSERGHELAMQDKALEPWSIRFSLLAAAFTAAEVAVPLFGDVLPRGAFVLLAFAASIGATVARIVAQPEMHQ